MFQTCTCTLRPRVPGASGVSHTTLTSRNVLRLGDTAAGASQEPTATGEAWDFVQKRMFTVTTRAMDSFAHIVYVPTEEGR